VLVNLPEEGEPRANVLGHIARTTFTAGEEYDEHTATDRLRPWCEGSTVDVASLRRFLVDNGFLHRDSGRYRLADHRPDPRPASPAGAGTAVEGGRTARS
jgi:hypothetical protein